MAERKRYYNPIEIYFPGDDEREIAPIVGMKALQAFEAAIKKEIDRVVSMFNGKSEEEFTTMELMKATANPAALIPFAVSWWDDEMLERTSHAERMNLLIDLCKINNLSMYIPFFEPLNLMDLPKMLEATVKSTVEQGLDSQGSSPVSLPPEFPGTPSITS